MTLSNAEELQLAQQIQQSFAPGRSKTHVHNLHYAARSQSARTLNGDYYDFIPLGPGKLGLLVADISGKCLPAALLMSCDLLSSSFILTIADQSKCKNMECFRHLS